MRTRRLVATLSPLFLVAAATAQPKGYYTSATLAPSSIIFTAENDLWRVPLAGGTATRLTTHDGVESNPVVSADGTTLAFSAQYEGPVEVYTMPIEGGLPTRRTYLGVGARPVTFSPSGKLVYTTRIESGPWVSQLFSLDLATGNKFAIPLSEAASATFDDDGAIYFTKPDFQGSHTRRYKGGTARHVWSYRLDQYQDPNSEATELTKDYAGESYKPQFWHGRIYFLSDRDGVTNIWSMTKDAKDLKQHTHHADFEVRSLSVRDGKAVYQLGADLWLLDLATDAASVVTITLPTDQDQTRERWIENPWDFVTSAHISKDGEKVALTSRGRVFVAPRKFGRVVEATRAQGVRYRDAGFMPDGTTLSAFSDQTGEVELWSIPANGAGSPSQLTSDATVLRLQQVISPDGVFIAHHDKDQRLFIFNTQTKANTLVDENPYDTFSGLCWSPDSRFLAYVNIADNLNYVIRVYDTQTASKTTPLSDRTASYAPAWSHDGKFLYFLSERNLQSVTSSPWGLMGPEPFLDERTKVYALALQPGTRSPFQEPDELSLAKDDKEEKKEQDKPKEEPKDQPKDQAASAAPADAPAADAAEKKEDKDKKKDAPKPVLIDWNAIASRVYEVPVKAGNYSDLRCNDKALFLVDSPSALDSKNALKSFAIDEDSLKKREFKLETVADAIDGYELSGDGKLMLIQTKGQVAIIDAKAGKADDLAKNAVKLEGWRFPIIPRDEWREMYDESWRLLRDYFYDTKMHEVDWKAVKAKYAPLVERVATRDDLADIMAQMSAELSALHHFVNPGDVRRGEESITVASLGAPLTRDEAAGGYRVDRLLKNDPDRPDRRGPLDRPDLDIKAGDIIELVNNVPTLSVPDIAMLLRNQAGKQVLLTYKRPGESEQRSCVIKPISMQGERDLRYHEWIEQRRELVEQQGSSDVGYVYLAAMGKGDFADFARQFYPVFNRKALIIDVRNNNGGNIDPWVLSRLMRKAWMYWSARVGKPTWGMQYAFRGPMCVLCDEWTASDGEAFSEGFKRLGLGKVIGTRTWGGEIWLSFANNVVDGGIASAGELGVFDLKGQWMIEGHGVEPDIVVENLPHATFNGVDAQLSAAVKHLQQRLLAEPVPEIVVPARPNKAK